jgi:uracil-DNA glycosylase family 4
MIVRTTFTPNLDSDTCRKCPYHPSREIVPHPLSGRAHEPLSAEDNGSGTLLLLQAPGVEEWSSGRALSSQQNLSAGQRFATALAKTGKRRNDFDIAEAVNCYPGTAPNGRDKQPTRQAIVACNKWLADLLNEKRYTKVVLFGRVAEEALALAWFSNLAIAQSITRIVVKKYITLEGDESIAEALSEPAVRGQQAPGEGGAQEQVPDGSEDPEFETPLE